MLNRLRSVVVYAWAVFIVVGCLPFQWWVHQIEKKDYERSKWTLYGFVSWFAGTICSLAGARVTVKGLENIPQQGSVVFVGNHQSMFDIPVMVAKVNRPIGFIAKEEMRKVPVLSSWIVALGSFFLPRGESRKSLEVVIQASKLLKEYCHALVIFPEGTRSEDGSIRAFKPGSLKIAMRSGASLVPFAIDKTYELMPKGRNWFIPQDVTLTFFPAYSPEALKGMDSVHLTKEIMTQISTTIGRDIVLTDESDTIPSSENQ